MKKPKISAFSYRKEESSLRSVFFLVDPAVVHLLPAPSLHLCAPRKTHSSILFAERWRCKHLFDVVLCIRLGQPLTLVLIPFLLCRVAPVLHTCCIGLVRFFLCCLLLCLLTCVLLAFIYPQQHQFAKHTYNFTAEFLNLALKIVSGLVSAG